MPYVFGQGQVKCEVLCIIKKDSLGFSRVGSLSQDVRLQAITSTHFKQDSKRVKAETAQNLCRQTEITRQAGRENCKTGNKY